jgi:hypothetical protein
MEWGVQKNRVADIAIDSCGKSHSQIFELLKHLQMFVYHLIKRYNELWKVEDRAWSQYPRSVRTEAAIKIVWQRIR